MRSIILFCLLALSAVGAFAPPSELQLRYYVLSNSGVDLGDGAYRKNVDLYSIDNRLYARRWPNSLPPFPTDAQLVSEATAEAAFAIPAKYRKVVAKQILEMDAGEKAAVDAAELAAEQAKLEARQATKAQKLKKAEKRVIKFLRAEAAIATNATSVTQAQLADYFEALELLPGNQGDNKAAKLERLLRAAQLNGGSEDDLYFHTDVSE